MKKGYLSSYFRGIVFKRLSAVETDLQVSHQHEFNGTRELINLFGEAKRNFPTRMLYFGETEADNLALDVQLTWYDARENHPTRSEHRLYFPGNDAIDRAIAGDLLIIALKPDDSLLAVICKAGSTYESQISWLFGIRPDGAERFSEKLIEDENDVELDFSTRYILEQLGIEVRERDDTHLDRLIASFGNEFPPTDVFSRFAREAFTECDAIQDPDGTLVYWIDREELLFRAFEKHLISNRVREGFADSVDDFLSYSLSVQNRRKSRAGYALENHLEEIFTANRICYSRGKVTENKSKPDFIFPDIQSYHTPEFPDARLTMLGVKSTCKDRWRQILSEAARIRQKHLLTLEPAISKNQTNEMQAHQLQLVLPRSLHATYNAEQQRWLISLTEFLEVVKRRQAG
jgi:hypothetical protein